MCLSSFGLAVFHCLVCPDLNTPTGPAVLPGLATFPVTRFPTPTHSHSHILFPPSLAPHIAGRFHSVGLSIVPSQLYLSCLLVLTCLPASGSDLLRVFGQCFLPFPVCLFSCCPCLTVVSNKQCANFVSLPSPCLQFPCYFFNKGD